jgi:hypothetical protein
MLRENGLYELVLRSAGDFRGTVSLQAVGEDGSAEQILVMAARTAEPPTDLAVQGGDVTGVQISAGVPLRLSVAIGEMGRRSLRAVFKP